MFTSNVRMNSSQLRLCLILLCTTQFVALLDFSITMIPLPQIQESLGFTPGALQWVINAYGVVIAGFLLLGGVLPICLAVVAYSCSV
ncbi:MULTISPECIES: hypothetical protein [unclassified Serratia (in: enterobacteria)]|uniref:hypothetical protein n=1 Tax=unclassified Serratia (in: enterobacteria) TaxID=2647522 RepID=UPI00307630B8